MATRDIEDILWEEEAMEAPETLLPPFPRLGVIKTLFPGISAGYARPGKIHFLQWVDFTLDHPDEIWEHAGPFDTKLYQYVNYLETDGEAPAFVVEVVWFDDAMEVNDFSLITSYQDMENVTSGQPIFNFRQEWERDSRVRALNEQALTKYDEGSLDEARRLIDTALQISGYGHAYLFNNRGLICWKMGVTDQAKRDFLESIRLDSANGDPYFNIGLIYFDESDFSRAQRYLSRAVDLNPLDSQFLTELGHLYLDMDREDDALKLFEQAFKNNPNDPQVDFHLGYYFLYKKKRPGNALKYYVRGLKKDPDDQFALADLAVAHWSLGNKRDAVGIRASLQSHPGLLPYTLSRLVYLNMEMGDYEAALQYYRDALTQHEPFEPEWLHYYAALAYAKTGRPKQALGILELAVRVGGEAVIKRARGEKALAPLKELSDFKKLVKPAGKRR
ncbi:MAG: tetratricopeptide repeat protein [Pseudomonadota bacterium]